MGKSGGSCSASMRRRDQRIADEKNKSSNMDDGGTTVTTTNESVEVAGENIYEVKYTVKNYENSRGNPDTLQSGLMDAEALIELIQAGDMRSAVNKGVIGCQYK